MLSENPSAPKRRRSEQISLRVTAREKAQIDRKAKKSSMSREQYMRSVLLAEQHTGVRDAELFFEVSEKVDDMKQEFRKLNLHLAVKGSLTRDMREDLSVHMTDLNRSMHAIKEALSPPSPAG